MTGESDPRSQKLNQIISEYLQAVEDGAPPDCDELVNAHPDLADELRTFFSEHDRMQAIAGSREEPTLRPNSAAIENGAMQSSGVAPEAAMVEAGEGSTLESGTRVGYFGDYELLEEIARGGMGVVYKARQVSLNRVVALKMILAGQLASEDDVRRFHAEAEAAANLDHPGIVPIYEIGEHAGQHYFSMGFVEGESLADRIQGGPLTPREAAETMCKIAEAVAFAHERGVIHRDLKPGNVLLDRNGEPKITDFGLAKRVEGDSDLTTTGQILGTPSYMPPEQASGRVDVVTQAADVYSLGAVLYCLLTGRPPFLAAGTMETLLQVLDQEPIPPQQLNAEVDLDLQTITLKCLEKQPVRRYASAREMASELNRFLLGEPIQARPVSSVERLWRWSKRKPAMAAFYLTAASLFLLLTVGGPIVAWRQSYLRDRAQTLAGQNRDLAAAEAQKRAEAESLAAKNAQLVDKERDARVRAERLVYSMRLATAQREMQVGNYPGALQNLRACDESFRGWEYDFLYNTTAGKCQIPEEHTGYIFDLAFSPDGKRLAGGGQNKLLKVWDVVSGRKLFTLEGHTTGNVTKVVFASDGTRLASIGSDGTRIWDAITGEEISSVDAHAGSVRCIAFGENGLRTVRGEGGRWPKTLKIGDAIEGRELATLRGHTGNAACAAFSPNGRLVVSGSWDKTLKLWDAATGQETRTLNGHTQPISSVAFNRDGTRIVSGDHAGQVKLWDTATGQELFTLGGNSTTVNCVAFSPDDTQVACGGKDCHVQLWDLPTGKSLAMQGHKAEIHCLAFSPDGQLIASGSSDGIRLWDATIGQRTFAPERKYIVSSVAFSPDGKLIAGSGTDGVTLWSLLNGEATLRLKEHSKTVTCVAFSRDGKQLVSGSWDRTLKVWDRASGQVRLTLSGHSKFVTSAAFSPDGTRIVSAGMDQVLKLWDAVSGQELLTLPGYRPVGFSPDGKQICSVGKDGLKLSDALSGKEFRTFESQGHFVASFAFSHDGARVATGGRDRKIKVWDVSRGREMLTLEGHTSGVKSVAFSPDGTRIFSGGADKTVRVWDSTSGTEVLTLQEHTKSINSVAVSPDGRQVVSGSEDGTIKIWDASDSR